MSDKKMILFALPVSVYSAKVRLCLREKQIEFEEKPPVGGSYRSEEYAKIVPRKTIPAIQLPNEKVLVDSEAINEFLNETFPDPPMLSENLEDRAWQRSFSRFCDTVLEPKIRGLFPFVKQPRNEEKLIEQITLINEILIKLQGEIDNCPVSLQLGESLTLSDCGFAVVLQLLFLISNALQLKALHVPNNVSNYFNTIKQLPNVDKELNEYEKNIKNWLESVNQ